MELRLDIKPERQVHTKQGIALSRNLEQKPNFGPLNKQN